MPTLSLPHAIFAAAVAMTFGLGFAPGARAAACSVNLSAPLVVSIPGELSNILIDDACQHVYVTNIHADRVEVISLQTGAWSSIPVGVGPMGLDTSPDGRLLYTANSGDDGGAATSEKGSISIIDTASAQEIRRVPYGADPPNYDTPISVAVGVNGRVFFTVRSGLVPVAKEMDPATYKITDYLNLPGGVPIIASPDRTLIAGLVDYRSFYQLNPLTDEHSTKILDLLDLDRFSPGNSGVRTAFGGSSTGVVTLGADGNLSAPVASCCRGVSLVQNAAGTRAYEVSGGIDVLDLTASRKIGSIDLGDPTTHFNDGGSSGVGHLSLSRDGTLLAAITDNGVSVVRADAARALPPAVPAAAAAACPATVTAPSTAVVDGDIGEVIINDGCTLAYATNITRNRVEVFSLLNGRFLTPIQVGSRPMGLDTSPDGKWLYVANSGSSDLSVVDLAAGKEVRRVTMATDSMLRDGPYSVAVAQSGLVLVANTFAGSGSWIARQYDPAANTTAFRAAWVSEETHLRASGDRSTIAIVVGDASNGPVQRYDAATDTLAPVGKQVGDFVDFIALDRTGKTGLVGAGKYSGVFYVLDANFNVRAQIPGSGRGVAVSPDGTKGYTFNGGGLYVYDLATGKASDPFPVSETYKPDEGFGDGVGSLAISRDGTLLAGVTGSRNLAFFRPGGQSLSAPQEHMLVASSANPQIGSYLRISSTNGATAQVTLAGLADGRPLASWTSPEIPYGASPQFAMETIEGTAAFTKPGWYVATIQGDRGTTFSHVLWQRDIEALTGLTACGSGAFAGPDIPGAVGVHNVHSGVLAGYPSYLLVNNPGAQDGVVITSVINATTGAGIRQTPPELGVPIAAGGGALIAMSDVERALGVWGAAPHYNVRDDILVQPPGYVTPLLQHLILNQSLRIPTSLSTACAGQ